SRENIEALPRYRPTVPYGQKRATTPTGGRLASYQYGRRPGHWPDPLSAVRMCTRYAHTRTCGAWLPASRGSEECWRWRVFLEIRAKEGSAGDQACTRAP